jgi:hypothetical protein
VLKSPPFACIVEVMPKKPLFSAMLLSCLVYLTEFRGEADYKVYLTEFRGEDTAKGLFEDCKFSKFRGGSNVTKIYVTKFRGEADLIVFRPEFVRGH